MPRVKNNYTTCTPVNPSSMSWQMVHSDIQLRSASSQCFFIFDLLVFEQLVVVSDISPRGCVRCGRISCSLHLLSAMESVRILRHDKNRYYMRHRQRRQNYTKSSIELNPEPSPTQQFLAVALLPWLPCRMQSLLAAAHPLEMHGNVRLVLPKQVLERSIRVHQLGSWTDEIVGKLTHAAKQCVLENPILVVHEVRKLYSHAKYVLVVLGDRRPLGDND